MKQKKFQNEQIKLRNKFIKSGVKMTAPETVFFSKKIKKYEKRIFMFTHMTQ